MNLLDAALGYATLGFSVIPLRGKIPAISTWRKYQHSKPSAQELRTWFEIEQHPGLGILTGLASGMIALDLDDAVLRSQFAAALPHLVNTRTIKTRRGVHYLYAVSLPVRSRRWRGADWQADGVYVVAPPSPGYQVIDDREPLALDPPALRVLIEFFEGLAQITTEDYPAPALLLTPSSAMNSYELRATQIGSRNHALFMTACALRDRGASVGWVEGALAHVHAAAPALNDHLAEPYQDRLREATATIRSAFKRPARPARLIRFESTFTDGKRIAFGDNGAREQMLQRDPVQATGFWRCYDALTLSGFTGGESFTFAGIYKKIAPLGVGRRALDHFINALSPDGEFLILRESPPSRHSHHAETEIESDQPDLKSQTAFVHTTKRSELIRGKKPRIFTFPSLDDLCAKLGLRRAVGDPISDEDVRTPRRYRTALEREFIRRKPGRYSLGILAQRIGVSKRAIQRYHALAGVESMPTFDELSQIVLETLDAIPQIERGVSTPYYLRDDSGKRYPAQASTATWLIQSGRRVFLMKRGFNYYWIGDPPAEISPTLPHQNAPLLDDEERFREAGERIGALLAERELQQEIGIIRPYKLRPLEQLALPYQEPPPIHETPAPPVKRPRRSKRYFRSELPNEYDERLAQRLHDFTTSASRAHGLAIYNARRIVEMYGARAVHRALSRIQWLQTTPYEMTNPTGLLISTARTYWRELHPGQSTPQFKAEKKRKGRSRYDVTQDAYWHYLKWLIVETDDQIQQWRAQAGLEPPDGLAATFDNLPY